MKVLVEQYVERVWDGIRYKGYIRITKIQLDFELVFQIPLANLSTLARTEDEDEVRQLFEITIKRDNVNIELTRKEYHFFLSTIGDLVIEFYNNPPSRFTPKGTFAKMLTGEEFLSIGTPTLPSMGCIGQYEFSPELCAMLSAPKFGCNFAS